MILNGFIDKLQGEISSFLMGMAFLHLFLKKLYFPWAVEISFLHTKGCGNTPFVNIISNLFKWIIIDFKRNFNFSQPFLPV